MKKTQYLRNDVSDIVYDKEIQDNLNMTVTFVDSVEKEFDLSLFAV